MSMWWMLGAQAGLSALSSMLGGGSQAKQANLQMADRLEQSRLRNEEVSRVNRLNLSNTMFNQGLMKMEDGMSRQQTLRNRQALGIGARQAKAEVSLVQGATGTIGASADAVLNDTQKKFNDAQEELARQRQLEAFRTNAGIREAYTNYYQSMGMLDTSGKGMRPQGTSLGSHLMGGLLSTGTAYLSRHISLGLGKKGE